MCIYLICLSFFQVLQEATKKIRAKYDFYEMTLQVTHFLNACFL